MFNAPFFIDQGFWMMALWAIVASEIALISIGAKKFNPNYPMSSTPIVGWFLWFAYPGLFLILAFIRIFYWPYIYPLFQ